MELKLIFRLAGLLACRLNGSSRIRTVVLLILGSIMSKVDEFRRHAALCQRMADESIRVSDKIQWLSLAQDWRALVRHIEQQVDPPLDGNIVRRAGN